MAEKILREVIIPKEEYLEFNVETSKPLDAYKKHYDIFARMLQVKRSRHYVRDLRFDATDNSFFIRIDISDTFDSSQFFTTSYTIETILSGVIPKNNEKTKLNIKLRAILRCEITIEGEGFWFNIRKFLTELYFKLFYEKVFEDRVRRLEEVLDKAKSEFIRILS
ncbi:MAG: hypothetical protein QW409_02010 [Candidatus Aenigmatarchaeota archaeon]